MFNDFDKLPKIEHAIVQSIDQKNQVRIFFNKINGFLHVPDPCKLEKKVYFQDVKKSNTACWKLYSGFHLDSVSITKKIFEQVAPFGNLLHVSIFNSKYFDCLNIFLCFQYYSDAKKFVEKVPNTWQTNYTKYFKLHQKKIVVFDYRFQTNNDKKTNTFWVYDPQNKIDQFFTKKILHTKIFCCKSIQEAQLFIIKYNKARFLTGFLE